MDTQEMELRPNQKSFVERFVNACRADDRIVAAFLGGSYAAGHADHYSDVDLCVITTDLSFEEFLIEREAFLRSLGDLVFHEDFGIPNISLYIFSDDTEGELNYSSESRFDQIHSGPFKILVDKKNILAGATFPPFMPSASEQVKKLGHLIAVFWHELSHFTTAMGRNQLWWARGQLEALRAICVNLARLKYNFLDPEIGEEPYFKVEDAMPVEALSALRETFCPMDKEAMRKAVMTIIHFYRELAPSMAQEHRVNYPQGLEQVMIDRLEKLEDASQGKISLASG